MPRPVPPQNIRGLRQVNKDQAQRKIDRFAGRSRYDICINSGMAKCDAAGGDRLDKMACYKRAILSCNAKHGKAKYHNLDAPKKPSKLGKGGKSMWW